MQTSIKHERGGWYCSPYKSLPTTEPTHVKSKQKAKARVQNLSEKPAESSARHARFSHLLRKPFLVMSLLNPFETIMSMSFKWNKQISMHPPKYTCLVYEYVTSDEARKTYSTKLSERGLFSTLFTSFYSLQTLLHYCLLCIHWWSSLTLIPALGCIQRSSCYQSLTVDHL